MSRFFLWHRASEHVVVYSTTPSAQVANDISAALVRDRLAACVQTVPGITSTYWWDGKVNTEQEHLLIIKTRRSLFDSLASAITKLHPYDTPEIVAQPVVTGSQKYLDWIDASTATPASTQE